MTADLHTYAALPEDPDPTPDCFRRACDTLRLEGATWFRVTIICEEYPKPPYPHGLYVQGWINRPDNDEFEFPIELATVAP